MSFGEKIHWSSLLVFAAGYGWYFWQTFMSPDGGDAYLGRLILVTIVVVAVIVVSAILFAIRQHDDLDVIGDERERQYELIAMRTGYFVLSFGVLGLFFTAYWGLSMFGLLNLMLAVFILSEVIRIGHHLWLYRNG